jgi:GrpB-like predicted nucleotidyltransferase (UPF0157 family)
VPPPSRRTVISARRRPRGQRSGLAEGLRPCWPELFAHEAAAIEGAIGSWITGGIHHVGSTAVPGLTAKPVIDIAVGVTDLTSSKPCIQVLAGLGYRYFPYRTGVMHWFCKPGPTKRTHHLHLLPTGSPRFVAELAFRDNLRAHPTEARRYQRLKQRLAAQYRHDREAYTEGKAALVAELTTAALNQRDAIGDTCLKTRQRSANPVSAKTR